MTDKKDFKKLVRERMNKTGESYATARMRLLDAPAPVLGSSNEFLERIRAEDNARVAREVEARRIRVAQEASGQWIAQTDEYPDLVERAGSHDRAQRLLVDAIWFRESGWRDHVDDETGSYLNLTDD